MDFVASWAITLGWSAVAAVCGYLLGAIPFGVVVARLFGQPDPRTHDSTHTGATNVFRTGGLVPGILVFVGDVGKGFGAAWLGTVLAGPTGLVAAGVLVVVGHCWSIFIGWDGGMGLATAAGLLLWLSLPVLIVELFVLLAVYYLVRDRYLTAILGVPAAPLALQASDAPAAHVLLALVVAALLAWRFWSERTRHSNV